MRRVGWERTEFTTQEERRRRREVKVELDLALSWAMLIMTKQVHQPLYIPCSLTLTQPLTVE